MAFKVKKRCIRCRKELRKDGTCQNPTCVRYVPEEKESIEDKNKEQTDE